MTKTAIDFVPNGSLLVFLKQTILAHVNKNGKQVKAKANYLCKCGNIVEIAICLVKNGHTKSCGCFKSSGNTRHGLYYHPLYVVYRGMKQRCYNKNNDAYKRYGGAGITICQEWLDDFTLFYNWAICNGWRKGMEIDKDIKGGKIYSPENCVIVTRKQNTNKRKTNHFITYKGERKTISEWSEITGINEDAIFMRTKNGVS